MENKNLQDSGSHLEQLSLPAKKCQVPKKTPTSLLTLFRRPLRDTVNLQEPNVNSSVVAEDKNNSLECATRSEGNSLESAEAGSQLSNVTITGPVAANSSTTEADASVNKNGKECKNTELDNSHGSYFKNLKTLPPLGEDGSADVSSNFSASYAPNQSWLYPKGTFFPSLHEVIEKNTDLNAQASLQLSPVSGSHQQVTALPASSQSSARSSLKQFFKSEHRKCLTPIWETSPLREGESAKGSERDTNVEETAPLFQNFFAQECAIVIDNIIRTSLQGTRRQFCAKSSLDNLEFTGIEEESLPDCTGLNSTLEWSCFQPEKEGARSNAGSHQVCPDGKVAAAMSVEKVQEVKELSDANSSSKEGFVSIVMGKTHSIHESHSLERFLKDTHILSDESSGRGKTFDKSDSDTFSSSYVLHTGNCEAGRNITVNLKDLKTLGSEMEADSGTSNSNCNNTYDLHPVPESERTGCDGVRQSKNDALMEAKPSSESEHPAGNICKNDMDVGDRAAVNGLNLDDTLDFKECCLITSTPMPLTKGFHFTLLEECERHSVVDCVPGCLKGDTVTLSGVDGSVSGSDAGEILALNVKKTKALPKPITVALRQHPTATLASGQKKGLLPPLASQSSARTTLPSAQPPATRRTSLPAVPRKSAQLSVRSSTLPRLSTPGSFGKNVEGPSGSSSKGLKTASCVEVPSAAAPEERRQPITKAKPLTASGLQKPRASGLPTFASKLGVKPQGPALPTGMKGRNLQQPTAAQKKPHGNPDDCSASKRRRTDALSTSTKAPMINTKPAGGIKALRRLTNSMKDLELKSVSSDTTCIINGPPREPGRPVRGTQGFRTPVTGLRVLESKVKNGASAPTLPKPVPLLKTAPSAPDVNGDSVSTSEDVPSCKAAATAEADTPEAARDARPQQTDCENCALYREEIARLKAALRELINGKDKKMEGGETKHDDIFSSS